MSERIYKSRVFVVGNDGELPKFGAGKARIKSLHTNAGYVWFNIFKKAVEGDCVPLDIGEKSDELFIAQVSDLSFAFENPDDKVVIIYERWEIEN